MKADTKQTGRVAVLAAGLAFGACAFAWAGEGTVAVATQEGVPGGIAIQSATVSAKVTDVDQATRKVTLEREDGVKATYTAGPEVVNFDQIRAGDQLKVTVAEALVIFLRKKGDPETPGDSAVLALAEKGQKPGMLVADTVEITAKVKSVDLEKHTATLETPGGKARTVPVRPDVDLGKVSVGEEVVIRMTEAVAIRVEAP